MTKELYESAYKDIEQAFKQGVMSAEHAMARIAILSIQFGYSKAEKDFESIYPKK